MVGDEQVAIRNPDIDGPGSSGAPSCAATAGSGPLRSMMRARMLGASAGTCNTIK